MMQGMQSSNVGLERASVVDHDPEALMLFGCTLDGRQQAVAKTLSSPQLQHNFTQYSPCEVPLTSAYFLPGRSFGSLSLSTDGFARGGGNQYCCLLGTNGLAKSGTLICAGRSQSAETFRVESKKKVSDESEIVMVDESSKRLWTDDHSMQHMQIPAAQEERLSASVDNQRPRKGRHKLSGPPSLVVSKGCEFEGKEGDSVFGVGDSETVLTSWGLAIPWKTYQALELLTQVCKACTRAAVHWDMFGLMK